MTHFAADLMPRSTAAVLRDARFARPQDETAVKHAGRLGGVLAPGPREARPEGKLQRGSSRAMISKVFQSDPKRLLPAGPCGRGLFPTLFAEKPGGGARGNPACRRRSLPDHFHLAHSALSVSLRDPGAVRAHPAR